MQLHEHDGLDDGDPAPTLPAAFYAAPASSSGGDWRGTPQPGIWDAKLLAAETATDPVRHATLDVAAFGWEDAMTGPVETARLTNDQNTLILRGPKERVFRWEDGAWHEDVPEHEHRWVTEVEPHHFPAWVPDPEDEDEVAAHAAEATKPPIRLWQPVKKRGWARLYRVAEQVFCAVAGCEARP